MVFKLTPDQDSLIRFGISFIIQASENIHYFNTPTGKKILLGKWNSIKKLSKYLFDKTGFSDYLEDVDLPTLQLNMYPGLSHGYFSEHNSIRFNIPTIFFSTGTDRTIVFKPEFQNTAILLHELDHYYYCKEYDAVGIKNEKRMKFDEEHEYELEIRGYNKMIDYYEKSKKYINKEVTILSLMKVDFSQTPFDYSIQYSLNVKTSEIIDHYIAHIKNNVLPTFENKDDHYEDLVKKDDVLNYTNVAKILNFKFNILDPEDSYPIIDIPF